MATKTLSMKLLTLLFAFLPSFLFGQACDFTINVVQPLAACPGANSLGEVQVFTTTPGDYFVQLVGEESILADVQIYIESSWSYQLPAYEGAYYLSIYDLATPDTECQSDWEFSINGSDNGGDSILANIFWNEPYCLDAEGLLSLVVHMDHYPLTSWEYCDLGVSSAISGGSADIPLPAGDHCLEIHAGGCFEVIELSLANGPELAILESLEFEPLICDGPQATTDVQLQIAEEFDPLQSLTFCADTPGFVPDVSIEEEKLYNVSGGDYCLEIVAGGCSQITEMNIPLGPPVEIEFTITANVNENNENASISLDFSPEGDFDFTLYIFDDNLVGSYYVGPGETGEIGGLDAGPYTMVHTGGGTCGAFVYTFEIPQYGDLSEFDFNSDGIINGTDLLMFLSLFGCTGDCLPSDLNGDGVVNVYDLQLFLPNLFQAT